MPSTCLVILSSFDSASISLDAVAPVMLVASITALNSPNANGQENGVCLRRIWVEFVNTANLWKTSKLLQAFFSFGVKERVASKIGFLH
jgi:hypothetical protein